MIKDKKKIMIIGSTEFQNEIEFAKRALELEGHWVVIPCFNNKDEELKDGTEYYICNANRFAMENADEVHVYWNGRSTGTIFDLGMAFALRKKVVVKYLGKKSFANFVEQLEEKQQQGLE